MNVLLSEIMLLAQEANNRWSDAFFGFNEGQRFVLLLVVIGCLTAILISVAGVIGGVVSSMHRRRTEAAMKQDLIDRGMSADEIAKIIESSAPEDAVSRWAAAWSKKKGG